MRSARRAAAVGTTLGLIIGAASVLWSCRTDRVSDTYKCFGDADCDPGRICDTGYCVVGTRPADARMLDAAECPAICKNTCDLTALTCPIVGTGSGNLTCPPGWKCDISCPTDGACGNITCTGATSCAVHCTADNACLGITCQTADCAVECTGTNACGNISCTSGNCNATCTGTDACENVTCQSGDCTAACTGSGACANMSCTTGKCTETCSGGGGQQVCGSLSCTSTGPCSRDCSGSNACNAPMSCSGGGTCTETCAGGASACGQANCGTGKCTSTCTGVDPACGTVNCLSSCGCQVNCDTAMGNTCPTTMNCPTTGNGANQKYCSLTGTTGAACSFMGSGGVAGCNSCP